MTSEPLGLGHKDLLWGRLKRVGAPLSEYCFSNLYLFRQAHAYEVLTDRDIFVRGRTYDGRSHLMPTTDIREMDIEYLAGMMGCCDFIYPVPEDRLDLFPLDRFNVEFTEGDSDYIYLTEKMSSYAGRHLHNKRNLLKQFTSSYRHEALPLTNDRLGDAEFVLRDWLANSGISDEESDFGACLEAIGLYEHLVLCGGIYYAEGEPAGFIMGEEVTHDTFVLHFAKARTKFKGVYQYMFNNFASILPEFYTYMNLEQDLDKATLREAKSSYLPERKLRKARVSLKG